MGPLVLLFVVFASAVADRRMSIAEKLTEDADLSQFLALLSRNAVANTSLHYRQMTLFAPTNEAFQRYNGEMDDNLVLYHISNLATTLNNIDYAISSELDGNPPLWVTRRRDATHDDLYVNNAKVLVARSYQTTNSNNKRQVLHVIDQVLQPLQPHGPGSLSSPVYSPNAYQFLEHSDLFNIGQHRLRSFRQKVNQLHKKEVFNADGKHTFFIPVDEGFKPTTRSDLIDAKVVDGHVIPHHVLFTKATPDTREFETLAFGDNVKVIISFSTAMNGNEEITYVKSNTVAGDAKHSRGVVLADIVRANIPVKNGVVHLIQRPLMVVDTSVIDFLKAMKGIEKEDGPLCKFYEVILDLGNNNQFLNELNTAKDMTLFAPSNEAWNEPSVQNIVRNHQKLKEILNLHLVRERLAMDTIIHNNMNQIYQAPTAMHRKYLYFNVITHNNNQTLTVEGGGVNATVTLPNIAATNGFVHIIDRVLGVPYTTIFEKLKTDPMLNITYNLGKREMFNTQLNDMEHRYTYFVPRDHAWLKFQVRHPSAFKALFKMDFGYYTKQILERHVIRASRSYTISDLKLHANETHPFVMPTSRDPLRLRVKESDKNYYVEWNGHWIHVFRPDVECTNGIIHVIDEPFLLESDVRATGDAAPLARAAAIILISIFITILQ
ncbi:fasciclin-1 isoform X4 [Leguminivora glycinivorella]|uniref:fasciclin-1 isoform X4 n=1 Tax=Leguminivora glycinivorella TaxID=1035111 RepID=UPI00200EFAB8|nr:fasciclin-1 isoform X4 [Leguminivora glycinivorella]